MWYAILGLGVNAMPIRYKVAELAKARNISIYKLKSDKVIGTATLDKLRAGQTDEKDGHIDTRSIESLCRYFQCQPGDLMEYVEDE